MAGRMSCGSKRPCEDRKSTRTSAESLAYLSYFTFTDFFFLDFFFFYLRSLDFFFYLTSLWEEVKTAPKFPSESVFKEKRKAFLSIKTCFHPC